MTLLSRAVGVIAGRALGLLRVGRHRLQRAVHRYEVDSVLQSQHELHTGIAELRRIQAEIHSVSSLSGALLGSESSDLRAMEDDLRRESAVGAAPTASTPELQRELKPSTAAVEATAGVVSPSPVVAQCRVTPSGDAAGRPAVSAVAVPVADPSKLTPFAATTEDVRSGADIVLETLRMRRVMLRLNAGAPGADGR